MSVEFGGGCTGDDLTAEALRSAGHYVLAHLYENYAASLFDYCVGILRDELAAVIAVEDTLVAVDDQISALPDSGRLRVVLYSTARRDCLSKLPRHRVAAFGDETTTQDGFAAEQAGLEADGDDAPVVAAALARLTDRDQEVLNLAYRHGIVGADLAAVLDVSPRRARAMLSHAGARFQEAAAAAVGRGDQVFRPGKLAILPLSKPPLTLRLRISLALGSYRRGAAEPTSESGGRIVRARHQGPRRVPRRMVVPALALVMFGVLGAVLYNFVFTSPAGTLALGTAAGVQGPVPASSGQLAPGLDPQGSVGQQKLGPFPGILGPTPLGVLPVPSPSHSGPPPTTPPTKPPPTTRPPTTPPPTTPPPTTPPPTTPPPTTPPPTTPPPTTPPPTTPPPTTPPSTAGGTPTPSP